MRTPRSLRLAVLAAGLAAGAAPMTALAQSPCGLRSNFRIVTNMSGATGPGEAYYFTNWVLAGPLTGGASNTTTNPTGQSSSITCSTTADYGHHVCTASGSAQSGSGNGVFFWLDEYFGNTPKGESQDTLVVTSASLPAGTPVQVLVTLTLAGSATLTDSNPAVDVRADASLYTPGDPAFVTLRTGVGTTSGILNTAVGRTLLFNTSLFASFRANGLLGGAPASGSLACNLDARASLQALTSGVTFTSCSGASYAPLPVCGTSDFNGDEDFGTDQDIEAFFACLGGQCCATCYTGGSDFNGDGDYGTDQDIESFFRVLGGGAC